MSSSEVYPAPPLSEGIAAVTHADHESPAPDLEQLLDPSLQELQVEHHQAHQAQVEDGHHDESLAQLHQSGGHDEQHPDGLNSTVEAAHHGLQALQYATAAAAAVAGPNQDQSPVPVTHNYPGLDSQHQQYMSHNGHVIPPPLPPIPPPSGTIQNPARQTRLREACDMCSARKVKCDESGPPCKPCASLNVECTFSRTTKRRGPPNKHAEAARAAKQPRLDGIPSPSPHNAAETLVSISTNDSTTRGLDAQSIAPWDILVLLVDDFFTYIHPLIPFPHEPTFRQRFLNREDQTNPQFLALLASMIGCLVASFPRSARAHLKSLGGPVLFPRAITMIERCRYVASEARGARFTTKHEMTCDDAATSYFLGLSAGYTFHWKMCRRYMTECLSIIQELGYYRRDRPETIAAPEARPFSHIEDQICKRLFYIMLLGTRSIMQLGAGAYEMLMPPPSSTHRYPDRPAEVDDKYIFHDHIMQQPSGTLSLMTGFNKAIDVYMATNSIAGVELAYGMTMLNWSEQKTLLSRCLREVKDVTAHLPPELRLVRSAHTLGTLNPQNPTAPPSSAATPSAEYFDDLPGIRYYPPGSSEPQANDLRLVMGAQPERRQRIQYNIQQANIYASELATRSFCVEYYMNLHDAARNELSAKKSADNDIRDLATAVFRNGDGINDSASDDGMNPDLINASGFLVHVPPKAAPVEADEDAAISSERELIVQDLLAVLASIPQRHMEPNGSSLHNKIRQVASTLLNDVPERKGPLAMRAEEHLNRFMEILARLERTAGGGPTPGYGDATQAVTGRRQQSAGGWGQNQGEGGVSVNGGMTAQDEEQELRDWADLRDHQVRFLQSGGFLGG